MPSGCSTSSPSWPAPPRSDPLRPGAWADLVVFDEALVGSGDVHTRADLPAGEARLFAESTGVDYVIVNGETIVDHGEITDHRPGRVLRSGRDTVTDFAPSWI